MSQELDFTLIKTYYHISPEGADEPLYELPATRLLERPKAVETLKEVGRLWKATSMELPSSFTGVTFFNLGLMNMLFTAQNNVFLRLPLDKLTLQLEWHHDHVHIGYRIAELDAVPVPEQPALREAALKELWTEFIQETAIPGIEAIAEAGGVKPDLIWNQFGAQIHSVFGYIRQDLDIPGLPDQVEADFRYIEALPAELFGRRRNPYVHKPRYIDNPWSPPNGTYILRSSCCMYDRRENGEKCYNCPQMLPEERDARRQQILAGQS
ncbi:(2Fe-2S)-binding protein [Paenibacillus soyae]|uniref:(2Fe-2S)-binding protein n=1 Tax=Paenibacillus soyae TaxID=2969249 RepID=A0A9X2MNC7_9BACL|nr:(2Fe-2S)-binding protein [Paenibacillus soyae]MCR2802831.1 (2Fe-2S)-binding protein [Paenibacillus soyae]